MKWTKWITAGAPIPLSATLPEALSEDERVAQDLDEYEAKESYRLEFVNPTTAIEKNRNVQESPYNKMMFERKARVLSVFNSMFLGLEVESLNTCEMFGFAGGVSQMIVRDDGKRIIKRISDMSFVR